MGGHLIEGLLARGAIGQGDDVRGACVRGWGVHELLEFMAVHELDWLVRNIHE